MEERNTPTKSDVELVYKIQEYKCEDSLKELINRHTPLCIKIYEKYLRTMNRLGIDYDEIYGNKDYTIYKSALSYKSDKGSKFSTWLANQIRYQCLNLMNNKEGIPTDEKELTFLMAENNKHNNIETQKENKNNTLEFINNIINQTKDKRIKKIFKLRYYSKDKNLSWIEVGEKIGASSQTCINIHNKVVKLIKNKLKSKEEFNKI